MSTLNDTLRAVAASFRRDNPGLVGGLVLIHNGKAYGWRNDQRARSLKNEQPGVYAVDAKGNVFIATGGSNYDGAERWIAND